MTQDGEVHDLVNAAETALSRGNIDQAKRDLLLARERLKDQNSPGQLRGRGQPEDDDQESMISVLQDLETAIHEADELRSQKKKRQPAEKKASRNAAKGKPYLEAFHEAVQSRLAGLGLRECEECSRLLISLLSEIESDSQQSASGEDVESLLLEILVSAFESEALDSEEVQADMNPLLKEILRAWANAELVPSSGKSTPSHRSPENAPVDPSDDRRPNRGRSGSRGGTAIQVGEAWQVGSLPDSSKNSTHAISRYPSSKTVSSVGSQGKKRLNRWVQEQRRKHVSTAGCEREEDVWEGGAESASEERPTRSSSVAESKADAKPSRSSAGDEEVDVGATLGWEEEVAGWPRWWEEGLQGKIMEEVTNKAAAMPMVQGKSALFLSSAEKIRSAISYLDRTRLQSMADTERSTARMEGGGFEQDSILATMMLAGGGPSIDAEEAARGEEQRVVRAALQALDVLRAVGQGLQIRGWEALVEGGRGRVLQTRGDFAAARDAWARAADSASEGHDARGEAMAAVSVAGSCLCLGSVPEASRWMERALASTGSLQAESRERALGGRAKQKSSAQTKSEEEEEERRRRRRREEEEEEERRAVILHVQKAYTQFVARLCKKLLSAATLHLAEGDPARATLAYQQAATHGARGLGVVQGWEVWGRGAKEVQRLMSANEDVERVKGEEAAASVEVAREEAMMAGRRRRSRRGEQAEEASGRKPEAAKKMLLGDPEMRGQVLRVESAEKKLLKRIFGAQTGLARCHMLAGRPEEALKAWSRMHDDAALLSNPTLLLQCQEFALEQMALACEVLGDLRKAAELRAKAEELRDAIHALIISGGEPEEQEAGGSEARDARLAAQAPKPAKSSLCAVS